MFNTVRFAFLVTCGLLMAVPAATARDPDGYWAQNPSPYSQWFRDWKNKAGGSCCGDADCFREESGKFEWRTSAIGEGYEVRILPNGQWMTVPDSAMNPEHRNPTGGAVLCWNQSSVTGFYCFSPPDGSFPPLEKK